MCYSGEMKIGILALLGLFASLSPASAVESAGKIGFYKGGNFSSTAHLLIEGPAATDLFAHLTQAPQTEERNEGIYVRRGKNVECIHFYKEAGEPRRCYLHLDESGLMMPGYAPSGR